MFANKLLQEFFTQNIFGIVLQPGPAASATNVGAGSPRAGGGSTVRQRGSAGGKAAGGGGRTTTRAGGTSSGGMWRFYSDDSPGIKV